MKADYIVEQPFGRRRSRRWLRLLMAAILLPVSLTAIILSYQNASAERSTGRDTAATDTAMHVITLPQSSPADSAPAAEVARPAPASVPDTPDTATRIHDADAGSASLLPAVVQVPAAPATATPAPAASDHVALTTTVTQPVRLVLREDPQFPPPPPAKTEAPAPAQDGLVTPESDDDFATITPPPSAVDTQPPMPIASDDWIDVTVKRGDSLSRIFDRQDLPASDWLKISRLEEAAALMKMRPGDQIQIRKDEDGHLAELVFPISAARTLRITRSDDGFTADEEQAALEHRQAVAQGTIKSSLYLAGDAAGLSGRLIMELTHIFAWNVDFGRDVRKGDQFTVIYDQVWHDGDKIRNGDILAAEFNNNGTTYRAFRYVDKNGNANYYTADGKSLRKALLRAPVKYKYISSSFNRHRKHPILHIVRPHLGTDYAAPMGTPVKAAGDGRVEFAGRKHGYGNVILIRHNARYETVYAHLHKFAKGVHAGDHVKQGQLIGYVGATGLATGPHLHFGVRVDGRFQNPRTVALPNAAPVPKKALAEFKKRTEPLLAQLDELDHNGPRLARNP